MQRTMKIFPLPFVSEKFPSSDCVIREARKMEKKIQLNRGKQNSENKGIFFLFPAQSSENI